MAHPVLINGEWREANASKTFQADNPLTREPIPEDYPVSTWADCDAALAAAAAAAKEMRKLSGDDIAKFLEAFADGIEARKDDLVELAHQETALPKSPRLADGELPRTTGQLRQAAKAVRDGSWRTTSSIRPRESVLALDRSVPFVFSARTTFRSHSAAFPEATLRLPSRRVIR